MNLSDFHFDLPEELIARFPAEQRDASRLLHLDADGTIVDRQFTDLIDLLSPNDCLIFNNTKVIPARLLGNRDTGGRVELLIERILGPGTVLSQVKSSNPLKPGSVIHVGEFKLVTVERREAFYLLQSDDSEVSVLDILNQQGHIPLPPYIDREDTEFDYERYQTVYAQKEGAVAAPTAGLHFSERMFQSLTDKGIEWDFVTLHVGSGTFAPVRVNNIKEHKMHSEWFDVPQSVVELVNKTRARNGRVVAVGTTSVRSLETASRSGELVAMSDETDIFIYPGFKFNTVDALVTNFHLPESTLILLVSAFSGKEPILRAYRHAVERQYRFFSYGDAMFLERNESAVKESAAKESEVSGGI
jgi:S-adenosylmethionine:tRNA ribosyltransferase-isomerase